MIRVLVTATGLPPGRNAVRALLQHDDIVVFATHSRDAALARLPFDVPKVRLPPPEDPDFAGTLRQFCLENDIEVVLPGMESIAIALAREKSSFASLGIAIPLPDYSVVLRGVDKSSLVKMAKAAGIPHPKSILLQSEDDFRKINSLNYPVIAKPTFGYGARGVLIFEREPSDWIKLKKALKTGNMLVQEYIPGGAGSIYQCGLVFDQNHDLKLFFQQRSTRTEFDFGGAALAGVSLREPILRSYCERLIREIGPWIGIVNLEFKRHSENGDFYIMDCNPRIWGLSSSAEDSGISFPFASVLVAKNKSFRSHEDYLTDVHTERQQLFDRTTYTLCCGKQVSLSRDPSPLPNGRRVISLITDHQNAKAVSSAVEDARIDAVLVIKPAAEATVPITSATDKLYIWCPPAHIPRADFAYWAAHLLQATEVNVIDGQKSQTHSWRDLRQSWWFGAG
jgi:carbamoylphosphate synthase large subunit